MAKTLYSHELRKLLCPNCGAPVEVAIAGGTVRCAYCGASHQVARRDESADIQQAAQAPTMGESERLAMLRAQDASPRPLPAGLERFVAGAEIQPDRVDEARRFWQLSRQQVQAGAPFPDQDRLYYLTVLLSQVADDATRRPLLESALELLPDQRHRHVLRCNLAEHAVLAGDLEAARQWLRPCNTRPTDLQMDTAYRIAAACLATAERDDSQVVNLLGTQPRDIPLADESEAKAELLRCNAVERKWGAAAATEQLMHLILSNPRRLYDFQRVIRELASLHPCPQSAPAASQACWQVVEQRLRPAHGTHPSWALAGLVIPSVGLFIAISGVLGLFGDHIAVRINLLLHPLIWLVIVPSAIIAGVYGSLKTKRALHDRGELGWARVVASDGGVQHTKNSSTAVQHVKATVQVGHQSVGIARTLSRETPVALGVYPCLYDPVRPEDARILFEPLR